MTEIQKQQLFFIEVYNFLIKETHIVSKALEMCWNFEKNIYIHDNYCNILYSLYYTPIMSERKEYKYHNEVIFSNFQENSKWFFRDNIFEHTFKHKDFLNHVWLNKAQLYEVPSIEDFVKNHEVIK